MKFLLRFKYIIDRKYTTFYYFICLVLVLKNIGYFNFDICLFIFCCEIERFNNIKKTDIREKRKMSKFNKNNYL